MKKFLIKRKTKSGNRSFGKNKRLMAIGIKLFY